jgi:hypothetical protein
MNCFITLKVEGGRFLGNVGTKLPKHTAKKHGDSVSQYRAVETSNDCFRIPKYLLWGLHQGILKGVYKARNMVK